MAVHLKLLKPTPLDLAHSDNRAIHVPANALRIRPHNTIDNLRQIIKMCNVVNLRVLREHGPFIVDAHSPGRCDVDCDATGRGYRPNARFGMIARCCSGLRSIRVVASEAPVDPRASLTTRCLSDVEAKPIRWLWPGRIARGKLTIIAGDPGLGKSQITASIASVVTTGGLWPVDRDKCERGDVLFLTAEDDPADTLRPRLEAAGADLTRVRIIDGVIRGYTGDGSQKSGTFSLGDDLQALEAKLAELGNVAVVVIDPISAYLGDTDSHKNSDVRGLLAPLSELAARHNVAIIGVSHMSKATGAKALMRVNGSLAFVAAARAAYVVVSDSTDKTRRLFLPMKNNVGPDATGLAFRIEGVTVASSAGPLATSRVSWESEPVSQTADEAMQAESGSCNPSALDEATDWLREILAAGPVAAAELFGQAKADAIADKTLRRASKVLEVRKMKVGMTGGWSWSLPPKVVKTTEDAQQNNLGTFDDVGHLREMREVEVEL
jgi:hypothetical protein